MTNSNKANVKSAYNYEVSISIPCNVFVIVNSAHSLSDSEIEALINENVSSKSYDNNLTIEANSNNNAELTIEDISLNTDWISIEYIN